MTANQPARLDRRHIERHVLKAIRERLGYPAAYALLSMERDDDSLIVRLNSGGNALAVEPYLRRRGYRAEYAGSNPPLPGHDMGYGCAVRVSLRGGPAKQGD